MSVTPKLRNWQEAKGFSRGGNVGAPGIETEKNILANIIAPNEIHSRLDLVGLKVLKGGVVTVGPSETSLALS